MNEAIQRLEEKIAYLEHHVTAQDKAMLQLTEDLARLRRELQQVVQRLTEATAEQADSPSPAAERPPHY